MVFVQIEQTAYVLVHLVPTRRAVQGMSHVATLSLLNGYFSAAAALMEHYCHLARATGAASAASAPAPSLAMPFGKRKQSQQAVKGGTDKGPAAQLAPLFELFQAHFLPALSRYGICLMNTSPGQPISEACFTIFVGGNDCVDPFNSRSRYELLPTATAMCRCLPELHGQLHTAHRALQAVCHVLEWGTDSLHQLQQHAASLGADSQLCGDGDLQHALLVFKQRILVDQWTRSVHHVCTFSCQACCVADRRTQDLSS